MGSSSSTCASPTGRKAVRTCSLGTSWVPDRSRGSQVARALRGGHGDAEVVDLRALLDTIPLLQDLLRGRERIARRGSGAIDHPAPSRPATSTRCRARLIRRARHGVLELLLQVSAALARPADPDPIRAIPESVDRLEQLRHVPGRPRPRLRRIGRRALPRGRSMREHRLDLHDRAIGALPVGLVHHEDVGDLHDPGLQGLHLVAEPGTSTTKLSVGGLDDVHLVLADAHGLHQDDVLAPTPTGWSAPGRWRRPVRRGGRGWPWSG